MLCPDSVSEHISEPVMREALASHALPEATAVIVRRALHNGIRDNCIVVVVARFPTTLYEHSRLSLIHI